MGTVDAGCYLVIFGIFEKRGTPPASQPGREKPKEENWTWRAFIFRVRFRANALRSGKKAKGNICLPACLQFRLREKARPSLLVGNLLFTLLLSRWRHLSFFVREPPPCGCWIDTTSVYRDGRLLSASYRLSVPLSRIISHPNAIPRGLSRVLTRLPLRDVHSSSVGISLCSRPVSKATKFILKKVET